MCPDMNLFSTYKPIKEDMVFETNDNSCEIVDVGTIKIKMFEGDLRTLSNVRHVPDLTSLGFLESMGYNNSTKDGMLVLLLKAREQEEIYCASGGESDNESINFMSSYNICIKHADFITTKVWRSSCSRWSC